jgi:hypothetical protein
VLIVIDKALGVGLFFVTLAMCAGAAAISIRKAMSVDPARVFQR